MKTATVYRNNRPVRYPVSRRYPNAADRGYHLRRLVDGLLVVATAAGGVTALIFLLFL